MTRTNLVLRWLCLLGVSTTVAACMGSAERQKEYLSRANDHYAAGRYDKARVDVRNALQIDGNHADARYLYALLLEHEQNWGEMLGNLQLATEIDPSHVAARIKLGSHLVANLDADGALEQAEAVLATDPAQAEAHALAAAAHFQSGNKRQAIASAETALRYEPGNLSAIAVLTQIYKGEDAELALSVIQEGLAQQTESATLKLLEVSVHEETGDIDAAAAIFRKLIQNHPENLYYHFRYVTMLEEHGRADEAEQVVRSLVNTRPDEVELKLWLAQYLVNHRDLGLAEATLRSFIERDPDQNELRLALAEIQVAQRDRDQARATYQHVIDADPQSESAQRARNAMVRLELAAGNLAEAEELLAAIFELEPENSDALLTRARLQLDAHDLDGAIGRARSVLRNQPDSVPALLLLAQAHDGSGASDLALDNYRQVLGIEPANEVALTAVTQAALDDGDLDLAVEMASWALRSDPENTEAARLLVAGYIQRGDLDEAVAEAHALAGEARSQVMGTYLLGRVYQVQQNYPAAAAQLEKTVALEPGLSEALQALVSVYTEMGQPQRAVKFLEAHAARHTDVPYAILLLGYLHEEARQPARAAVRYQEAIERFPESPSGYLFLGDLLYGSGDVQGALETYLEGLTRSPDDPGLLVRAAQIREVRGELDEAISLYETALTFDDVVVAKNNLAMLYADYVPTEENLRRAAALMRPYVRKTQPELLDTIGWIHYRLGEGTQAVRLISAAISNGGGDPEMHYHLAMAYLLVRQPQLARQELIAALSSGTRFRGWKQARAQLQAIEGDTVTAGPDSGTRS